MMELRIVPAREEDAAVVLRLIAALGDYEKLRHEVVATEEDVRDALFGPRPLAEVVIAWATPGGSEGPPLRSSAEAGLSASASPRRDRAEAGGARDGGQPREAVGFALFFHNFSTFLGRRGLYLEDLFVVPEWRGRGIGKRLLSHLAKIAVERNCGRMEWAVLDWNAPAIGFYERLGARIMEDWRICRLTGDALTGLAASRFEEERR